MGNPCKEYFDVLKKIPNFCGISSTQRERLLKHDELVENISQKYGLKERDVHENVPPTATVDLLKFPQTSDIRLRAEEKIAATLKSGFAVTRPVVNKFIGYEPKPRKVKARVGLPTATARATFALSDKIKTILSVLDAPQKEILYDMVSKGGYDNEYAALIHCIVLGKKEMNKK